MASLISDTQIFSGPAMRLLVTYGTSNRSSTSVTITLTTKIYLVPNKAYYNNRIDASFTINGSNKGSFQLKPQTSGKDWSYTVSKTYTITGLSNTQTSFPVSIKVWDTQNSSWVNKTLSGTASFPVGYTNAGKPRTPTANDWNQDSLIWTWKKAESGTNNGIQDYRVTLYKDKGSGWANETTGPIYGSGSTFTYSFNISSDPEGTKYQARVTANAKYNTTISDYSSIVRKNHTPTKPKILINDSENIQYIPYNANLKIGGSTDNGGNINPDGNTYYSYEINGVQAQYDWYKSVSGYTDFLSSWINWTDFLGKKINLKAKVFDGFVQNYLEKEFLVGENISAEIIFPKNNIVENSDIIQIKNIKIDNQIFNNTNFNIVCSINEIEIVNDNMTLSSSSIYTINNLLNKIGTKINISQLGNFNFKIILTPKDFGKQYSELSQEYSLSIPNISVEMTMPDGNDYYCYPWGKRNLNEAPVVKTNLKINISSEIATVNTQYYYKVYYIKNEQRILFKTSDIYTSTFSDILEIEKSILSLKDNESVQLLLEYYSSFSNNPIAVKNDIKWKGLNNNLIKNYGINTLFLENGNKQNLKPLENEENFVTWNDSFTWSLTEDQRFYLDNVKLSLSDTELEAIINVGLLFGDGLNEEYDKKITFLNKIKLNNSIGSDKTYLIEEFSLDNYKTTSTIKVGVNSILYFNLFYYYKEPYYLIDGNTPISYSELKEIKTNLSLNTQSNPTSPIIKEIVKAINKEV